jgi:hypothetical protein
MTSRFNNLNRSIPGSTTGESIGVGIALFAGVMMMIVVGNVLATLWPGI